MPKLAKNKYRTLGGEVKVNSYLISIPKKVVSETNIKETDNLKVRAENNKIIIEKTTNK